MQCRKCKEEKNEAEFHKHKASKTGLFSICKTCNCLRNREWSKNNKDKVNSARRKWRKVNKKHCKVYRKQYTEKNKEHILKQRRERWYIRRYGISTDDYNELLKAQNGLCAICNLPGNGKYKKLHVDHCHKTGKLRSLLCVNCNRGLGYFQDNPALLSKASLYISKFEEETTECSNGQNQS